MVFWSALGPCPAPVCPSLSPLGKAAAPASAPPPPVRRWKITSDSIFSRDSRRDPHPHPPLHHAAGELLSSRQHERASLAPFWICLEGQRAPAGQDVSLSKLPFAGGVGWARAQPSLTTPGVPPLLLIDAKGKRLSRRGLWEGLGPAGSLKACTCPSQQSGLARCRLCAEVIGWRFRASRTCQPEVDLGSRRGGKKHTAKAFL